MFIDELYIYSLWIVLHVFELFKNEFDKNTWLFGLKEQFSGGDFKTVKGVRIIRVFELIGTNRKSTVLEQGSPDIMRQTACLVVNPIIVDGYASLFNCTTAVQASDSMTASS